MKIFKTFMCLAAVAMAFTGCSTDEFEDVAASKNQTISFSSVITRTAFGEPTENSYPTLWTGNETVKIGLNNATKDSKSAQATVTASKDGKTATWTAEIEDDASGSYTLYALCPASTYLSTQEDGWGVTIPVEQTPSEKSCDEAAQIIIAKSATTTELPTSVEMHFKHLTAYGKLTLKNLNLGDAKVQSIVLTAEDFIVGRFNYDFESNEVSNNSGSTTLTIKTDKTEDVWFAIRPCNLATSALTVVVATDKGTFTKEVEVPEGCEFKAGVIANMAINMEGVSIEGPVIYNKLTDVANLTAGDQVIIAAADYNFAISTTQNNNNRAQTAITKSEDGSYIADPSSAVQIFTVETGTVAGSYAFNTGSGYIYAASSSSNHMKTQTSLDGNASWKVSVNDGVATIVAQGSNTRATLQYNQGSSLFSCYSSASQKAVAIYYIDGITKEALATPVVTGEAEGTTITLSWEAVANAASYIVSCDGQSYTTTETTYSLEGLDPGTEYTISVVAVPNDTETYNNSEAGIVTVKTEGSMVYTSLSDIIAATEEGTYNIENVTVVAIGANCSLIKGSDDAFLYVYNTVLSDNGTNVKVGDVVTIEGATTTSYNGKRQLASYNSCKINSSSAYTHPTATVLDSTIFEENFSMYDSTFPVGRYVEFEGAFSFASGKYYNITVEGLSKTLALVAPYMDITAWSGKNIKVTGYSLYGQQNYAYFIATNIELVEDEVGATVTYTKVTEAPADWSGSYLIVYENGTDGYVFNGADAVNGYASVTIDNNTITGSYENYEVTIASMTDGYSIYCSNGYMSGTSGSNKLNFGTSPAANTIVLAADQTTTITSNTSVLRFNNASNQMRFRYYKSTSYASQKAITLYKKVE